MKESFIKESKVNEQIQLKKYLFSSPQIQSLLQELQNKGQSITNSLEKKLEIIYKNFTNCVAKKCGPQIQTDSFAKIQSQTQKSHNYIKDYQNLFLKRDDHQKLSKFQDCKKQCSKRLQKLAYQNEYQLRSWNHHLNECLYLCKFRLAKRSSSFAAQKTKRPQSLMVQGAVKSEEVMKLQNDENRKRIEQELQEMKENLDTSNLDCYQGCMTTYSKILDKVGTKLEKYYDYQANQL